MPPRANKTPVLTKEATKTRTRLMVPVALLIGGAAMLGAFGFVAMSNKALVTGLQKPRVAFISPDPTSSIQTLRPGDTVVVDATERVTSVELWLGEMRMVSDATCEQLPIAGQAATKATCRIFRLPFNPALTVDGDFTLIAKATNATGTNQASLPIRFTTTQK